jgi:branched-chain amino acid transport system ATP-binding protein
LAEARSVTASPAPAALSTRGLAKHFGALQVIRGVDFTLRRGSRHALIGPNGAGKTTFVNLLTGALQPSGGAVFIGEKDVTSLSQSERARHGIARTFQINQLFRSLTVFENVSLAVSQHLERGWRLWRKRGGERETIAAVLSVLDRLGLADDAFRPVGELSYGTQRLVEIAIALGMQPEILLMDEPAAGVPLGERERVLEVVEGLGPEQAILIIEHDMDLVFRFATEITVLVDGAVLCCGTPDDIASDERVREAYLGGARDA